MRDLKMIRERFGKWFIRLALVFPLALLLCSCETMQQDIIRLNDQVVALNGRVEKLEGSMEEELKGEVEDKIGTLRESQAVMSQDLEGVKGSLETMSARVEDNNRLVKRAIERDTTEQDQMRATIEELNSRVVELEAGLNELRSHLRLGPSAATGKTTGDMRPEAPAVQQPAAREAVKEEEKVVDPETKLYEDTLATYKKGMYEEALAGFNLFIEKYPKSDLADNAQFWIGECHTSMKQYEQAILAYQNVIKKYPKGNQVPNAMLRQALAFHEINDKISTKLLLKKIIKNYPGSSEARIAATKLKTLK